MKKILNGSDLAGYIKERQAKDVRRLNQTKSINPKLAIVLTIDDPVIDTYIRLKLQYGKDIGVEADVHRIPQEQASQVIKELNTDSTIHGIIVQLPLEDPDDTDKIVNQVAPSKDVDSLGVKAKFDPATPMAILWLLAGYNIDLTDKKVLLIGRGKLVGAPLEKILTKSGIDVSVIDRETKDLKSKSLAADVIITATGNPSLLFADMIKPGAVIIDAGVASEEGKKIGDVAADVYERDDISITPKRGGVGPLTVSALFENVIRAAANTAD